MREETDLYKWILKWPSARPLRLLTALVPLDSMKDPISVPIRTSVTGTGHLEGRWQTRKRSPEPLRDGTAGCRGVIASEVWRKAGAWRRMRISSATPPTAPSGSPHCANFRDCFPLRQQEAPLQVYPHILPPPAKCIRHGAFLRPSGCGSQPRSFEMLLPFLKDLMFWGVHLCFLKNHHITP